MQGLTDCEKIFMHQSSCGEILSHSEGERCGRELESLLQRSDTGFLYVVSSKPTRAGTQDLVV